jgi:hypothetical protein
MLLPWDHSRRKTTWRSTSLRRKPLREYRKRKIQSVDRVPGIGTVSGFAAEAVAICGSRVTAIPEIRATLIKAGFRHGTASFKQSNHTVNFS